MILIITESDVLKLLDERLSLKLAEQTFNLIAQKRIQMPSKLYLNLPHGNDYRAMPAAILAPKKQICGVKWISVFPGNRLKGKATVNGTVLLSSASTGEPLAVIEANALTALRTAAAATLAAKYLANRRPKKLAIIGAGLQAAYQLRSLISIFKFDEIKVWGFLSNEARNFCSRFKSLPLKPESELKNCVLNADIITTCTPSRKPLIKRVWVKPGAHINAIGADAKGKEELEPSLLRAGKVIVDQWEQASHSGEINVPVSKGLFSKKNLYGELSEIVSCRKRGRLKPREITIFDSTGLAALDIYFAHAVYSLFKAKASLK